MLGSQSFEYTALPCANHGIMNIGAALAYHRRHKPLALLVHAGGQCVEAAFEDGFSREQPHALYSGTKSFWGVTALAAQREGLLRLDEPAWNGATVRQLLTLTAGVPFGGLGASVPVFEKAVATPPNDLPGRRFTYGGIALQIFGAFFAQRLAPLGMSPQQYLRARILERANVAIASWRVLKDGTQPLPTGAYLTIGDWARYGEFVRANAAAYAECFVGTAANPRYGLGWWLAPKSAPSDLFYASGSGGQALYVSPEHQAVIARFGSGGSFNHEVFLRTCFS